MRAFTELRTWRLAHEITLEVYRLSRSFPGEERFGLTAQIRRSAASVAANIAEGSMSRHAADFARSLNIAEKEAAETAYHLILARDLGYLTPEIAAGLSDEVDCLRRMLNNFRRRVVVALPATQSERTAKSQ